ncbi:hypothetical protein KCP78_16540 [Salmonella enterica subsp. enterica]|nr:hypothetical protein KCP78_16540 [Salmonella enterica subsp. enterica]
MFNTNIEATQAIARQLRLRIPGGINHYRILSTT